LVKVLGSRIIGRDEDINMLMTAVIARENAVMIGPPGTAKTMLITMLSQATRRQGIHHAVNQVHGV